MIRSRRTQSARRRRGVAAAAATTLLVLSTYGPWATTEARQAKSPESALTAPAAVSDLAEPLQELQQALVRLPLAALLGAALAMRPRRRGTPARTPAVIHTQIILAIVGAAIMLIVGASLARAFGIVGAANLIRYRSKIDDPKDAGVMLCALAMGLAAGVGLYALAIFSTAFIVGALAVIESFAPKSSKRFEVQVKVEKGADKLRPKVEEVFSQFRVDFELRTTAEGELSYEVQVPFETDVERITDSLLKVGPAGQVAVTWDEKKPKIT